jgi:hypothetical protein
MIKTDISRIEKLAVDIKLSALELVVNAIASDCKCLFAN